jgi:hypothetical protein
MCGKNPFCTEDDMDLCDLCYYEYIKEKDILYKPVKQTIFRRPSK